MKTTSFSFLILTLLVSACSHSRKSTGGKKYFEFSQQQKEIAIPEFKEEISYLIPYNGLLKYDFCDKGNSFVLSGFKRGTNKIFIYTVDKTTKKVKTDSINFKFDISPFSNAGYISRDSAFVAFPPAYREFNHDSILMLIDHNGKILHNYSFDQMPVLSSANPEYANDDRAVTLSPLFNLYEPFAYKNGRLFVTFDSKGQLLGDPAFFDLPKAGYIDTKNGKFTEIKITYPDIIPGKNFFPKHCERVSLLAQDSNVVFLFKYSPEVIRYNFSTEAYETFRIKSALYDTVYSFADEKSIPRGSEFEMPFPQHFNILYNKFSKRYFITTFTPSEFGATTTLLITDKNFNTLAEGLSPRKTVMHYFFTKNYTVLLGSLSQKPPPGKMYITFYKLQFSKKNNQQIIAEIMSKKKIQKLINKPLTHYVKKNTKIKGRNYTTVFMYYEMCPNYRDFVLEFFAFNKKNFEKYNVNLVFISKNPKILREKLRLNKILPENNRNIFIDSSYIFASYNHNKRNDIPRTIVVRNKKVITDTIFTMSEESINDFQRFLISSGKEQKALLEK